MKKILISLSIILGIAAVSIGGTEATFKSPFSLIKLCPSQLHPNYPRWPGCPPWPPPPPPPPPPPELDLKIDINGVIYDPLDRPLFVVDDLKPGDHGEETISFHVDQPACGFIRFDLKSNRENGCTEPEQEDDHSCGNPGEGKGELDEEIKWIVWKDEGKNSGWQCSQTPACEADPKEGDNILNGKEKKLASGEIDDLEKFKVGELSTSTVSYYGIAWCFGKWKEGMECSGKKLDNETQTDSLKADLIFIAEQKTSHYDSGCPKDDHDFDKDDFDFDCGNLFSQSCFSNFDDWLKKD